MKIRNIKIVSLSLALIALAFTSCQEQYLDQEPQDSVTEAVYFETPEHFENAANNLYSRLGFDYEGDQDSQGDTSSDLSGNLGGSPSYSSGNITTPATDNIWSNNYTYMRAANQIIEKAVDYTGEISEIQVSIGTAYFFRAWHHYNLLTRFGGVPLANIAFDVDSPELYAARNSRYEVASLIFSDLEAAISRLPSAVSMGTADQGKLSLEAAKAFKARVLLYEATWEKYVGTSTDGDGVSEGAGSAKPSDYPSVQSMLTDAKQYSIEVMNSGAFELWDHRAELGEDHLYYLYNLEDGGSNPAGLSKANNKEFIFQTVYDYSLRQIRKNLTHAKGVTPSRKMMDMYLCEDGLPVQYSSVFEGYDTMTSEFENRDYRLKSFVHTPLREYWGWGANTNGGGAQYDADFATSGVVFDYRYVPQLLSPGAGRNIGYLGRKFATEYRLRETREESFNYPQIRLAEVMLIYAESTVELGNGTISDADLDISINKIRARANVAPLTNALIAPYSDLTMLGEIRRERAIELEGENFRFDDLKRWAIAEVELNQDLCVVYIEGTEYETADNPKNPGTTIYNADAFPLGLTTTEQQVSSYAGIATTKAGALILDPAGNRNFALKNYLDAIPTNQIGLNESLLQNPGW
ncbi:RagB/SusD family nutrient uptake outer membrane protein [Polaribacter sp. Asnod1-A03]|uniref:RagB/SusD family nutrient uptake outer membrane protein n=1 Tax=Polaribacter sp. Asnod1-A03 TaxID=3160581 RepID=UPI00386C3F42